MTSGFGQDRARQLMLRDLRNFSTPEHVLGLDVSSGILVPLYDPDTNMVFLSGKGDRYIQFVEVTNQEPFFVPGLRYTGEQIKGACLVPKRALDVMNGEINRVLQLADSSIVPITWQIPRKTYRDFHADIYPDTPGPVPAMGPTDWKAGANSVPALVSLDPAKRPADFTKFQPGALKDRKYSPVSPDTSVPTIVVERKLDPSPTEEKQVSLTPMMRKDGSNPFLMPQMRPESAESKKGRSSKFGRQTKFRHLLGKTLPKAEMFENLRNLSKSVSSECDFIHANVDRIAVPIQGPGGKMAVFETSQPGRLPDGVTPSIINGSALMDFAWDPFDNSKLACCTEDGKLNVWKIPDGGLSESTNEPSQSIIAHADRITIVKFHPLAAGIVATAAHDFSIKIWNLEDPSEEKIALTGHTDQIYSFAWSQCGQFIASSCRDGKVRIYNPRAGASPVIEGGDVCPKKGSRIVWTLDGEFLVVTGFTKMSERTISVYRTEDLKELHQETLSVSPAVLIPFYDEDSSTLFLNGKGETSLLTYEVALDAPYLFPLSPFKCPSLTQGFGFLGKKSAMNVRDIEFAKAYRLTNNTIEPVSFTVPRVRSTYFQDDLFPPTRVLWEPTLSGSKWLSGETGEPVWMSLKPDDMRSVSGQSQSVTPIVRSSANSPDHSARESLTDKEKEKGLSNAVSDMMETSNKLEQDRMEGVDAKEWD